MKEKRKKTRMMLIGFRQLPEKKYINKLKCKFGLYDICDKLGAKSYFGFEYKPLAGDCYNTEKGLILPS